MLAIRKGLQNERGFTLVEVTIILLVLVVLSTIMLPQLGNFNRLARYVVVKEDVAAICATLKKFLDEVMLPGPYSTPGGATGTATVPTGLLVGPGGVPSKGLAGAVTFNTDTADQVWDLDTCDASTLIPVAGGDFSVKTDKNAGPSTIAFKTDCLENHLQINNPGGVVTLKTDKYKNVIDDASIGAFFGWRGPYFNEINADPWGTRYSVNTFGLHGGPLGVDDIYVTAVICISFGPNKKFDTEANMPGPPTAGPVYAIGGDDIAAILSAAGPF